MKLRSKQLLFIWIGMIAIFAVATSAASGHFGGSGYLPFAGRGILGFKTLIELNLTENQKANALKIIDGFMAFRDSKKETMQQVRAKIKAVMKTESFDEDRVREVFRQATAIREELFVQRVKMIAGLKAILTPEQLELLKQKRAERQAKFRERALNRLQESSQ